MKALAKRSASSPRSPRALPTPSTAAWVSRPRKAAAVVVKSVTRDDIDRFWRRKKMEEEEHLLAALKAAARLRARALKEEDYRKFEESLRDLARNINGNEKKDGEGGCGNNKELRVGIKDWWTKSKYAYLNQPATKSMGEDAASKSCSCAPPTPPDHFATTALGVF